MTPENSFFISIVIPVYNEENRIAKTLHRVEEYLNSRNYEYELLLVDDGSTDHTPQVLTTFAQASERVRLLQNSRNEGKGYSVRRGVLAARGKYILYSDADLSTPIEEVESLLSWLNQGYHIAIGSRGLPQSDIRVSQPWYRKTMGKIFNLFVRTITLPEFKDTQCGFKCFERSIAQEVFKRQKVNRFGFDVEVLYIAKKMGERIKEVPIQWYDSRETKVKAFTDSVRMLLDLFKIRLFDSLGYYRINVN